MYMLAQREQWKKRFQKTKEEISNLSFVKSELNKHSCKQEILTEKYRDECIDIHTRSFMQVNGVSKALGLDINDPDEFHDCTMISKHRIDHAILTGFSNVCLHKKTNQILYMSIVYDECDLPPPISSSKFRSKAVKIRNSLLDHFEHNDSWICQMKENINNTTNTEGDERRHKLPFGKVVYGAYGAKNPNIDVTSLGLTHYSLDLMRQINNLSFYKLGYKYIYGIGAHPTTRLYALAIDNVVNNINNYKNVNYNCQGYAKNTSIWNFSKYEPFVEYIAMQRKNGKNIVIDDNFCWLICSFENFQIIKNNDLSLKQFWDWKMYKIHKQISQEFVQIRQNKNNKNKNNNNGGQVTQELSKHKQVYVVSKL